MASTLMSAAVEVESIALNSIVGAAGLVAALSWLDAVRHFTAMLIQVPKNTGSFFLVTALLTTLLSVITFMIVKAVARNVTIQKPGVVFAATR